MASRQPFSEPLQDRILAQPAGYKPLANFSCGHKRRSEWEVNHDSVLPLYLGARQPPLPTVVLLEKAVSTDWEGRPLLVGIAALADRRLELDYGPGLDPAVRCAYVEAIGTSEACRGYHLQDDPTTSAGGALLQGAVEAIKVMFGSEDCPLVKALILPDNTPSKAMFDERGFENYGLAGPLREQLHVISARWLGG